MSTVVLLIDTATPVIYTLSLHDALPISLPLIEPGDRAVETVLPLENDGRILNRSGFLVRLVCLPANLARRIVRPLTGLRSEEHTSELQSLRHLVCRLLLEKKKTNTDTLYFVDVYCCFAY